MSRVDRMNCSPATYEQVRDVAEAWNWTNRQIKDALYAINEVHRRDELLDELGRERGPAFTPKKVRGTQEYLEDAKAAQEQPAVHTGQIDPVIDGTVFWCDAAPNTVKVVINGYGKIRKFDNGGYRIGLVYAGRSFNRYNTVCPDQFSGECFAVLKAVEEATAYQLSACTIRNDRIGGFDDCRKRNYKGAMYLRVAKRIADEHGLDVTFDLCTSEENKADYASRNNLT